MEPWLWGALSSAILAVIGTALYFGSNRQQVSDLLRRVEALERDRVDQNAKLDAKLDRISDRIASLDIKLAALGERLRLPGSEHKDRRPAS